MCRRRAPEPRSTRRRRKKRPMPRRRGLLKMKAHGWQSVGALMMFESLKISFERNRKWQRRHNSQALIRSRSPRNWASPSTSVRDASPGDQAAGGEPEGDGRFADGAAAEKTAAAKKAGAEAEKAAGSEAGGAKPPRRRMCQAAGISPRRPRRAAKGTGARSAYLATSSRTCRPPTSEAGQRSGQVGGGGAGPRDELKADLAKMGVKLKDVAGPARWRDDLQHDGEYSRGAQGHRTL